MSVKPSTMTGVFFKLIEFLHEIGHRILRTKERSGSKETLSKYSLKRKSHVHSHIYDDQNMKKIKFVYFINSHGIKMGTLLELNVTVLKWGKELKIK